MTGLRKLAHSALASEKRLIALCYVLFFAVSVLVCLASFAEDAFQRAIGNVVPAQLDVNSFSLIDTQQTQPDTFISTSPDPRMVLEPSPAYVRTVTVDCTFSKDPGEFCIFYKTSPQQEEYDATRRAWGYRQADGSYTFTLPKGRIYGLRLDPGIFTNLAFEVHSITINAPRSFFSWFAPSLGAGAGGGAAAGGGCAEKCARAVGAAGRAAQGRARRLTGQPRKAAAVSTEPI